MFTCPWPELFRIARRWIQENDPHALFWVARGNAAVEMLELSQGLRGSCCLMHSGHPASLVIQGYVDLPDPRPHAPAGPSSAAVDDFDKEPFGPNFLPSFSMPSNFQDAFLSTLLHKSVISLKCTSRPFGTSSPQPGAPQCEGFDQPTKDLFGIPGTLKAEDTSGDDQKVRVRCLTSNTQPTDHLKPR